MTQLLVIFDVDGTLVDGQAQIVGAMTRAFEAGGLVPPERAAVLSTVGLSLPETFAKLLPDHDPDVKANLIEGYKQAFFDLRVELGEGASPLYDGAIDTLRTLAARDDVFLGIATGKSRRGLDHMLDAHNLRECFHTLQPADDHPSKPHPAMVEAALDAVGLTADRAVMVGDTTYDMDMARYASVSGIGVDWGYHPAPDLVAVGAETVLSAFDQLIPYLNKTGRLR